MNGLVQEGIKQDLGEALLQIKRPTFFFSDSPETVTEAKVSFDFVLAQSIFSDWFTNKPLTWNVGLENVLRQKKKKI
jgi:hypothetical protein